MIPSQSRQLRGTVSFICVAVISIVIGGAMINGTAIGDDDANPAGQQAAPKPKALPNGLIPLTKEGTLLIDPKRKLVVCDGKIVLREGQLEMFACPKGTKEHESIVAIECKASEVHAALVAVGAKKGQPVQFDPKYAPATGQVIDIHMLWKDQDGKNQRAKAQQWVKHVKTGKAMEYDWVFGGSGFWKDPDTGYQNYYGDDGDFICVSNFATATLDLPVASSQDNAGLLFTAFTENIPPIGTRVRMILVPRVAAKEEAPSPAAKKESGESESTTNSDE